MMVPITNSLAFLFTVLGEWWAEGKVIGRGEGIAFSSGMVADLVPRYVDWYGVRAGWDRFVHTIEEYSDTDGMIWRWLQSILPRNFVNSWVHMLPNSVSRWFCSVLLTYRRSLSPKNYHSCVVSNLLFDVGSPSPGF